MEPITPSKQNHDPKLSSSENLNPNNSRNTPSSKSCNSKKKNPVSVSATSLHSPLHNRIRQRKFVVAKKNNPTKQKQQPSETASFTCKCGQGKLSGTAKCPCVAYENLRASQEEFFNNRQKGTEEQQLDEAEIALEEVIEASLMVQDLRIDDNLNGESGIEDKGNEEDGSIGLEGSSYVKRRREQLLEEARNSIPETGCGRVMHLVKAFEKLLSLSKVKDEKENDNSKVMKWALPGLQFQQSSDLVLTSENLGLDSRSSVSSSWDSSRASCSVSTRTSNGGRRSRRNSLESCGTYGERRWRKKKKQLKVTSQKPFKLRTEQRGKLKEEEFMKKMQETMAEEEKLRIPIAQGLPWTTDEPECLIKPPVKECTKPIDLKLHSDIRAVDRAEFDHQVAEKMNLIEQLKLERERQKKLMEEEEIRRLRKELIPKAQPMPYFDRPFVPRRSMKHPTIPREPKFHIPHRKQMKCCMSWNDMSPYSAYLN